MFRKALLGCVVTCVFALIGIATMLASASDIVLYAGDATNLRGNWARIADSSAAGGQMLTSADMGWANAAGPQASPADSFDFVFTAPAATAYHVWMRVRAQSNSKYNDSVFAQFSDAVDGSGAALYAIGTANGLAVNLAADTSGSGLVGWGWQDGAYWLAQPVTIRFAATGTHTLRIQTREDGVQIDQVVLSAGLYLTSAPGPVTNDATIVAKPVTVTQVPTPWSSQDVGATGLPGRSSLANGAFTAAGSGADIWGTADAFQFVAQPVSGDTQIVARVATIQNTNQYAKAGVMLRESTAAGAAHVLLDLRPNGSIEFMSRPSTGAATTYIAGGVQSAPAWLKLTRSATTITGSVSANGTTWTQIGSTSIAMTNTLAGLAVTSHNTSLVNTSTFDNVVVGIPPAAPMPLTPVTGATGVSTAAAIVWSGTGAESYDVRFGATNPPSQVANGLTAASYAPAAMANGTTYYWQVTAKTGAGSTVGPLTSFTTIIAAPGTPVPVAPVNNASGVALTSSLAWNAATATSYDVAFGTTNPPATVATNLTTAAFTPTGLVNGMTYYWQVTAKNAGGATTGSVWSFTTGGIPTPWQAQDVGAVGVAGSAGYSASAGSFTVAGAGADIWGSSDAFQFVSQPLTGDLQMIARVVSLQNTGSYAKAGIMLRESAAAGAAHVILDVRPNGSIEFMLRPSAGSSTTFVSGGTQSMPTWLKLTRSGSTVGASLSADGSAWTSIGSVTVTMASSVQVGMVVTSHDTSLLTTAVFDNVAATLTPAPIPTPTPTPPPLPSGAPTTYNALSDRNAYPKPAVPTLGAAGYTFNDPTFGSKILRVTDGNTRPGAMNRSYRVASNAHLAAWNSTSTAFFVMSNDGTAIPFAFDPASMTASRIEPSASGNGGLSLAFYVEPQFSLVNPNAIFGAVSGSNNRTISQYDFSTGAYSKIVDLDTITGGLAGTYVGGLMTGGTPSEKLMTFFGGGSQDNHYLALWTPIDDLAGRKVVNTLTSTINGVPTGIVLNFRLHSAQIDKSGRFVFLYPTSPDLAAPRNAAQVYIWDTQSDSITAMTNGRNGTLDMHPGGHDAAGYGYWVNADCCTSSSWDAAQWQFRSLTDVTRSTDLISPVLATKEIYLADHTSWNNARPDALVPVISSTYRYGDNTTAWRAWDDEILGIDTTGGVGGVVYRFAHHRSVVGSDNNPAQPYFWYEPIANVSPDGRWVLFTSNWEKTLGRDSSEGTARQDVFIVQLTPQ